MESELWRGGRVVRWVGPGSEAAAELVRITVTTCCCVIRRPPHNSVRQTLLMLLNLYQSSLLTFITSSALLVWGQCSHKTQIISFSLASLMFRPKYYNWFPSVHLFLMRIVQASAVQCGAGCPAMIHRGWPWCRRCCRTRK